MGNISTIKSLDELIIKLAWCVKVKNALTKPLSMIHLKCSLKTLTLMIVYFGEEWSTLNRMKLFTINWQKMEIRFTFRRRDRETFYSPFDETPGISSPSNSVSTLSPRPPR